MTEIKMDNLSKEVEKLVSAPLSEAQVKALEGDDL